MLRDAASIPLILIVEDDPDIRFALTEFLEHDRFNVVSVGTGAEAICRANAHPFSAAILDLGLPDVDGLDLLKTLKDQNSDLQVIILTALNPEHKSRCLQAGALAFLSKPYNKKELKAMLRRAMAMNALSVKVKQAMQALQMSEHATRQAVLDGIQDLFWYKDRHNRIIRLNARAAESVGRTVQQLEGQSTYDVYPKEASKYHQDDLAVITSGIPKYTIVELYEVGPEAKRWVETDKVPYLDADGNIIGVLVFATDTTQGVQDETPRQRSKETRQSYDTDMGRWLSSVAMAWNKSGLLRRLSLSRTPADMPYAEGRGSISAQLSGLMSFPFTARK